jgi:hypothetical protein
VTQPLTAFTARVILIRTKQRQRTSRGLHVLDGMQCNRQPVGVPRTATMGHKGPQVEKETAAKLEVTVVPLPKFSALNPVGLS